MCIYNLSEQTYLEQGCPTFSCLEGQMDNF